MPLLELKDVMVSFPLPKGRAPLLALEGMDLSVEQGELVALVGPSGCGKTTALNVLAGQVAATKGQVRLAGEPVNGVLPSVGYISQGDTLLPWRTVLDNVALAMELRGVPKAQRRERARALMAKMGLAGFEDNYPRELSGGMKQRCAIAQAFSIDPPILLMDEPFGALDAVTRARLQDLIRELWAQEEKKKTVFFVTHDVDEALLLANRILVLGQSPSHIIYDVTIPEEQHPTRDTLFENMEMMKLRMTLINQINKDVTTHI